MKSLTAAIRLFPRKNNECIWRGLECTGRNMCGQLYGYSIYEKRASFRQDAFTVYIAAPLWTIFTQYGVTYLILFLIFIFQKGKWKERKKKAVILHLYWSCKKYGNNAGGSSSLPCPCPSSISTPLVFYFYLLFFSFNFFLIFLILRSIIIFFHNYHHHHHQYTKSFNHYYFYPFINIMMWMGTTILL